MLSGSPELWGSACIQTFSMITLAIAPEGDIVSSAMLALSFEDAFHLSTFPSKIKTAQELPDISAMLSAMTRYTSSGLIAELSIDAFRDSIANIP
jgi:hypothetical protein